MWWAPGASGAWRRAVEPAFPRPLVRRALRSAPFVSSPPESSDLGTYFEPGPVAHAHQQLAEETPPAADPPGRARRALKEGGRPSRSRAGSTARAASRRPRTRRASACSSAASTWLFLAVLCLSARPVANRRLGYTHAANLVERRSGGRRVVRRRGGAAGRELTNWLAGRAWPPWSSRPRRPAAAPHGEDHHGVRDRIAASSGAGPPLDRRDRVRRRRRPHAAKELAGAAFAAPSDGALWASICIAAVAAFPVCSRGGAATRKTSGC